MRILYYLDVVFVPNATQRKPNHSVLSSSAVPSFRIVANKIRYKNNSKAFAFVRLCRRYKPPPRWISIDKKKGEK